MISSLQHLVSELKLLNQVILSLHHSCLLAFVIPFINRKNPYKLFLLFQVLFLHFCVLAVHHSYKPQKRKEIYLLDSIKFKNPVRKCLFPFCFVSIIKNCQKQNLHLSCFHFLCALHIKSKKKNPCYFVRPYLFLHFLLASEKKNKIFKTIVYIILHFVGLIVAS